jgi:hypothetical protein
MDGSRFDVCTGIVLQGPAMDPLKIYRLIVENEIGWVETVYQQIIAGTLACGFGVVCFNTGARTAHEEYTGG